MSWRTSRWLLPVALAIPSVAVGQSGDSAFPQDCSLSRPPALQRTFVVARPSLFAQPPADFRTMRFAEIDRSHKPVFAHSNVWAPPAFAQPVRPRGNTLPRFLVRNPILAKPLIRKLANQLAGRELFDTPSAGSRRISIAPLMDPGSDQYGVRVRLALSRPD